MLVSCTGHAGVQGSVPAQLCWLCFWPRKVNYAPNFAPPARFLNFILQFYKIVRKPLAPVCLARVCRAHAASFHHTNALPGRWFLPSVQLCKIKNCCTEPIGRHTHSRTFSAMRTASTARVLLRLLLSNLEQKVPRLQFAARNTRTRLSAHLPHHALSRDMSCVLRTREHVHI